MTPQEEIQRAQEASVILTNPIFKEAIAAYEQAILAGIRHAAIVDDKLREKLILRYCILGDVVSELRSVMEGGKVAVKQLEFEEKQKTLKERFANFLGVG